MLQSLNGIRILDLSLLVPGAACTHFFADFGADVIKVEQPPTGDYIRDVKPGVDGWSLQAQTLDRNKRSLALDLTTGVGREILGVLAASVDAVVVVSSQAGLKLRGADWDRLRALNPALVYLSFTGYGSTGALADLPSHGSNLAAFAAVHGVSERDDGVLVPAALPYGRYRIPMEQGALFAAFALLSALTESQRTGEGQFVDIALVHLLMAGDYAAMTDIVNNGSSHMVDEEQPTARYGFYRAGDGEVLLVCPVEERFWDRFCEVLGREDLRGHGDWSENQMDFASGDVWLYHQIQATLATRPRHEWLAELMAVRVPCAPLHNVDQAVEHPDIGRHLWYEQPHPRTGRPVRLLAPPIADRIRFHGRSAPVFGQDTADVLEDLNVDIELVAAARVAGALGVDHA
jgi:crotonobetainyl-CoA:carnitine CoA-transferase CaiB-like acyl-CoA transferase